MSRTTGRRAVVVGAGPNGLVAAIRLASAGWRTEVLEANDEPGGAARTAELTLPGHLHDVGSAVHPLAAASPVLRGMPLADHGLRWLQPEIPCAHPLGGDRAVVLGRTLEATASDLGPDGRWWRTLAGPVTRRFDAVMSGVLGPPPPRRPVAAGILGAVGVPPASWWAAASRTPEGAALLAGLAAHAAVPLDEPFTSAFAVILGAAAHRVGWPLPTGGAGSVTAALVGVLASLGGVVRCGRPVRDLDDVRGADLVLLDLTPAQALSVCGDRLPGRVRRRYRRWRYGPGVCKVDHVLEGPVPWRAGVCRRAGTVHVGGTFEEIAAAEATVAAGGHPERPFVLVAQPTVVDPSRAPAGRHVLWSYTHVPPGSPRDVTDAVEAQIERFAPGFRDLIVARRTHTASELCRLDANLLDGDISGGSNLRWQAVARPGWTLHPYDTGIDGVFLCSASTPPGAGVHGLCGWYAAGRALASRTGAEAHGGRR